MNDEKCANKALRETTKQISERLEAFRHVVSIVPHTIAPI